ncbi:MAG: Crp/Fnr family transcriptional regulator [Deltaproteobacteria bacterium]|nr:Crp/Fnr family transcriptional regulator [Deltaproteobacteria bacterium]
MTNRTFLRDVTLFSDLSDSELRKLESFLEQRSFPKSQIIFHAHERGNSLFIIKRGRVKISMNDRNGREIILGILKAGDFFGEMALLDSEPRSATVSSLEPCQALVLSREQFLQFIPRHPEVVMKMLTTFSQRLRKADEKISRLVFADAYEKVASVLVEITEERKIPLNVGAEIVLSLSRKELADLVGLSRETLTRVIAAFQKAGLVRIDGRRIGIISPTRLKREATRSMSR